jgi:hypothetical protein
MERDGYNVYMWACRQLGWQGMQGLLSLGRRLIDIATSAQLISLDRPDDNESPRQSRRKVALYRQCSTDMIRCSRVCNRDEERY